MVTVKKDKTGKYLVDFNTTMFFQEMLACPVECRAEFIDHIKLHDSEWLFRFCIKHFGDKIFWFEKEEEKK
jgi:hypothetical protein